MDIVQEIYDWMNSECFENEAIEYRIKNIHRLFIYLASEGAHKKYIKEKEYNAILKFMSHNVEDKFSIEKYLIPFVKKSIQKYMGLEERNIKPKEKNKELNDTDTYDGFDPNAIPNIQWDEDFLKSIGVEKIE